MTFLVISSFHGGVHATKETTDPRTNISYGTRKQSIIQIVRLTDLGANLPVDVLKQMHLEGLFDRASPFRGEEKPKVVEAPKPPKNQIVGGS